MTKRDEIASITETGLVVPRRSTVHDYHAMIDAGVLGEDARVELVRGEILEMAPINPWHSSTVDRFTVRLASALAGRAIVRAQKPSTDSPR